MEEQNTIDVPKGSILRSPTGMGRGVAHKVEQFCYVKSIFKDRHTKQPIMKIVPVYKEYGMTFHDYMSSEFDNKPIEYAKKLNTKIKNNKNIRVVFYGKISGAFKMDILEHDQEVNQETLTGVRIIEESEKGAANDQFKKRKFNQFEDDDDDDVAPSTSKPRYSSN